MAPDRILAAQGKSNLPMLPSGPVGVRKLIFAQVPSFIAPGYIILTKSSTPRNSNQPLSGFKASLARKREPQFPRLARPGIKTFIILNL